MQINLDECYADENKIYQLTYKCEDIELVFVIDAQKTEILPDNNYKVVQLYDKNILLSKIIDVMFDILIIYVIILIAFIISYKLHL
jgi:hypothetical protein